MTNATHTPGPWRVSQPSGNYIDTPTGSIAALMYGATKTDARLIAAAPDMLAVLDQVDAYLSPLDGEEDAYAEIRSVIQQAIRKAKGE